MSWSRLRMTAVAAALLAATTTAEAAIIYTNPEPDIVFNSSSSFPVFLDIDDNLVMDFSLFGSSVFVPQIPAAASSATFGSVSVGNFVVGTFVDVTSPPAPPGFAGLHPFVSALPLNTTISDGQSFVGGGNLRLESASAQQGSFSAGEWSGQVAFAGLKFLIGTDTHFGWAQLQVTGGAIGLTTTVFDYAYCDQPNTAIDTGQTSGACGATAGVPEPSSLLLLTTGAVAVAALRRGHPAKARNDGSRRASVSTVASDGA